MLRGGQAAVGKRPLLGEQRSRANSKKEQQSRCARWRAPSSLSGAWYDVKQTFGCLDQFRRVRARGTTKPCLFLRSQQLLSIHYRKY